MRSVCMSQGHVFSLDEATILMPFKKALDQTSQFWWRDTHSDKEMNKPKNPIGLKFQVTKKAETSQGLTALPFCENSQGCKITFLSYHTLKSPQLFQPSAWDFLLSLFKYLRWCGPCTPAPQRFCSQPGICIQAGVKSPHPLHSCSWALAQC